MDDHSDFKMIVGTEQELISAKESYVSFSRDFMVYVAQYTILEYKDSDDKALGKEQREVDEHWVIDRSCVATIAKSKTKSGRWQLMASIRGSNEDVIIFFKSETACVTLFEKFKRWRYPPD